MSWVTFGNWGMNSPMPQSLQTTAKLESKFINSFLLLLLLTCGLNSKIVKLFDCRNSVKMIYKWFLSTSTKETSKLRPTTLNGFEKRPKSCQLMFTSVCEVEKQMWLTNMSFWKRRKNWIQHYNSGKHIFKIIDSSVESGWTARIVLTQQKIECVVFLCHTCKGAESFKPNLT